MRSVKILSAGLAGAVVAGVLVGVLARLLMRLVSLAAGGSSGFSLGGSVSIVVLFVAAMLPVAVAAAFTASRWRWLAGAAGVVLLALPAVGVAAVEIGDATGFSAAQWVGVVVFSIAVFATILAAPAVTVRVVDRLVGREPTVIRQRVDPVSALTPK